MTFLGPHYFERLASKLQSKYAETLNQLHIVYNEALSVGPLQREDQG